MFSAWRARHFVALGVLGCSLGASSRFTGASCDGKNHTGVLGWGSSQYGQLGLGDARNRAQPQPVGALQHTRVCAIAAGAQHSAAVTTDGDLFVWGRAQDGRLGLGIGASGATQALPVRLDADTHFGGRRVAQVACGERHSAAVTEDGRLFTWGRNLHGELGRGTDNAASAEGSSVALSNRDSAASKPLRPEEGNTASAEALASTAAPGMVTALQHVRVTSVAVGRTHTLALTDDGRVFAFGARTEGTGGLSGDAKKPESTSDGAIAEDQTPALVALPEPVRAIAAGAGFSVFLSASGGRVYTCGADDYGQTGLCDQQTARASTSSNARPLLAPRLLRSLRDAGGECTAIAAGQFHAAAVTVDGRVFTWGEGREGQCAHGDKARNLSPRPVQSLDGYKIVDVACGAGHSAFLGSNGELFMSGRGRSGQLGRGDHLECAVAYRLTPLAVNDPRTMRVRRIALGDDHCIALSAE